MSALLIALGIALYALDLPLEGQPGAASAPGKPAIGSEAGSRPTSLEATGSVERAFRDRQSGLMVDAEGIVQQTLRDDREGSRHQRFILRLASGHTLLVAHNIDLASRVPVSSGESLRLRGQYEWNDRGGVVHWTHHDPQGRRPGGWIEHDGIRYR